MVVGPTDIAQSRISMHAYDFPPLFRSIIGFDLFSRLMDPARQVNGNAETYPPYNIEKSSEDSYRISHGAGAIGRPPHGAAPDGGADGG